MQCARRAGLLPRWARCSQSPWLPLDFAPCRAFSARRSSLSDYGAACCFGAWARAGSGLRFWKAEGAFLLRLYGGSCNAASQSGHFLEWRGRIPLSRQGKPLSPLAFGFGVCVHISVKSVRSRPADSQGAKLLPYLPGRSRDRALLAACRPRTGRRAGCFVLARRS